MAVPKLCENCGKPFSALSKRYLYCKKCRKHSYYKAKPLLIKKCIQCGEVYKSRRVVQKFCSEACKNKFHRKNNIKVKIKVCKLCGKEFTCTNNSQLYCNNKCYLIAKNKRDKELYVKRKSNV